MNAPLPAIPVHLAVRASLHALVHDWVRRCYLARLERAGAALDDCRLCGSRRPIDAHISDACDRCGLVEEHETDRERVARETRALVPYAVPVGGEGDLPI